MKDEPDVRGGAGGGDCIISPIVEGECTSTLTAAFDHIFCLDKFRSKGKREKLMEEAFKFEQMACTLIDKKREKKDLVQDKLFLGLELGNTLFTKYAKPN